MTARPALVERDEELEYLEGMLACAWLGQGKATILSGALASGKSALLEAFAARAASGGAHVLRAGADRAERETPWRVLDQLFEGVDGRPELPHRPCPAAPDESDPILLDHWDLLRELARTRPVAILIDDLHQCDAATLSFLAHVLRRLRSLSVLMVASECPGLWRDRILCRAELLRLLNGRRLGLLPLSPQAVGALLTRRFGPHTPDAARALHRAGGGYPLLVEALIDDQQAPLSAEIAAGPAFTQAVMSCLDRCDPALTALLRALSRLGGAVAAGSGLMDSVFGITEPRPAGDSALARMCLRLLAATAGPQARSVVLRETADFLRLCGDHLAPDAVEETCPDEDGSGPAGHEPLSEAEKRVATLVAAGLTNRQIASRLSVTVSTVEQHLTRIYRKLNVSGRHYLPSALPDIDRVPDGKAFNAR